MGRNIYTFNHWEVYQTTDGLVDGPRICFEYLKIHGNGIPTIEVPLSAIDTSLPVFISARLDTPLLLEENSLYMVNANVFASSDIFKSGNNCDEGLCSGMFLSIQIPDSTGDSITSRDYIIPGEYSFHYYQASSCVVTEKFDNGNYLDKLILKLTLEQGSASDSFTLGTYGISFELLSEFYGNVRYLQDSIMFPATDTGRNHTISTYDLNFGYTNYIVLYSDNTYPSPNDISLVEFIPNPNPTTIDTITFTVEPEDYIAFQPFTNIVGAHPEGDTINRHVLYMVNNGADLCFYAIVEKVFEHGDRYVHRSGSVSFNSPQSCFAFGKGGALEVADGTTFHYGGYGKGIMALRTGSTILLGQGSELVVHGRINMLEYAEDAGPQQIYMTLNRSSRLTFADGARLTNKYSKDGSIKLNVYMNGGILDDSGLPLKDRKLINRIYSSEAVKEEDLVRIKGNPFVRDLHFSYTHEGDEQTIFVKLSSLAGKAVGTYQMSVTQGVNNISISTGQLNLGVYLLRVYTGGKTITRKVIKL